jgi:serine/threonine-protein kinase
MPPHLADRNLLFGIVALQMDFIDRDQLVAGMNAWVLEKHKPLGQILSQQGALSDGDMAAIESLVERHLLRHDNDPERSLAALSSIGRVRDDLAELPDPDLQASLTAIASERQDGETTVTYLGSPTAPGGRFRVLRPHAQGGLGVVSVAMDEELHREVALKEIQERYASENEPRSRFLLEAEITGGLEHPGIVPVYGLGHHPDGRPFYAMRFVRGESLKDAIARFHGGHGLSSPADGAAKASAESLAHSLEFRRLLARFLDVCNAIAYAHSRGVLHRDIKPGNILLGPFGETLVVDWGLAKVTGRPDHASGTSSEATLRPQSASGVGETFAGTAIGTPAYMSPEQAEGRLDLLGPATDVYGLGVTLYAVLAGHAPFDGENVGEILMKVRRGEFPRPRSVQPRVPRALEAICLKAMALGQSDRYSNPRDLALDIEHWLADEPVAACREPWPDRLGRWVRKHQTLVTSAAAMLLMAACAAGLVAAQRSAHARDIERKNFDLAKANRALGVERNKAEEREKLAVDAVKRFRDAVIEEPQLKNNAELEGLRKRLLKEPLAFFRSLRERLQADKDTRTESLARLAEASFALGYLTDEIGDKQDALIAYAESLAIRQRLADANPSVNEFQRDLAACHHNIGLLLQETGKPADAMKSYEAARAIWTSVADANPSDNEFQRRLASCHTHIGNLLGATGKPTDAMKSYEAALAIQTRLAAAKPFVTDFQRELAGSHLNIGKLLRETGKPVDALKSYETALVIQKKLAAANPSVTDFESDVAQSHDHIGDALHDTGKPVDAWKSSQTALAIWAKLADANPSVNKFQISLARSHNNIGGMLMRTGRAADALKSLQTALAIQAKLAAANPSVTEFQRQSAISHNNMGFMFRATGKPDDALKSYESALAIQQNLAREHPESAGFLSELGVTLNNIASIDFDAKRFVEARDWVRQAVECQRRALASYPAHPEYRQFMADHLANLIKATRLLGDLKGIAEAERQLVEFRETDPTMAAFDARLRAIVKGVQRPKDVGERLHFAQRAYEIARYAAAARLWQEALDADPKLGDDRRTQHRYNAACAAALAGCGQGKDDPPPSDEQKTKLRQQALKWLTAELAAWSRLLETASKDWRGIISKVLEHSQSDSDLAGIRDDAELAKLPDTERAAFHKLWADVDGLLKKATGKLADALKSYQAALAIQRKLADANPSDIDLQGDLAKCHVAIGGLLFEAGKPAEALNSFRAALAIRKNLAQAHPESPELASQVTLALNSLVALDTRAKRFVAVRDWLREAVEWDRRALASNASNPKYRRELARHIGALANAASALGDLKGVAEAQRQVLELHETDPTMAAVDARLKAIVNGERRPKDVSERLQLAQRAYDLTRHAAAARLWQEALELDPKLGDDRQAPPRYDAACAAALSGCGQGKDDPPPSDEQKAKLRQQALDWLTAELGAWAKLLATANKQQRGGIVETLEHWRQDIDLAGIRDDAELAKLPEAERAAFGKLWADVDALVKKAAQL